MIENGNFEETFISLLNDYNKAIGIEKIDILVRFAISIIMALNEIGISVDIITKKVKDLIKEKKN